MKKKNNPREECAENGYHEWEVVGVAGTLPHQEVELQCGHCNAGPVTASFEHDEEDDDE